MDDLQGIMQTTVMTAALAAMHVTVMLMMKGGWLMKELLVVRVDVVEGWLSN